jgi:MFS family permease
MKPRHIPTLPLMIYLPAYFQNGLGYDNATSGLVLLAYTLPVLLLPPFGEYLALRYQPRSVIPAGLLITGLGCLAITWGSTVQVPTWLTVLPGCMLAGIGVGLANTTVTSTATGAVPPGRAGMASGIDMTVRLVTLATNIALMGLMLPEGLRVSLQHGFASITVYAGLGASLFAVLSYITLRSARANGATHHGAP